MQKNFVIRLAGMTVNLVNVSPVSSVTIRRKINGNPCLRCLHVAAVQVSVF